MRRGAKALGLDLQWQYEFVPPGAQFGARADTVILDVGGKLGPGILDHHDDATPGTSTVQMVSQHPEYVYEHLLGPWLERQDGGQAVQGSPWQPIICTHWSPDLDACSSALLVQKLVEDGRLPPWAWSLEQFVTEVDQGRWNPSPESEHTANCVAMALYVIDEALGRRLPDGERMALVHRLIEAEAESLMSRKGGRIFPSDWYGPHAGGWRDLDEDARQIAATIDQDIQLYQADQAEEIFSEHEVNLPLEGGALHLGEEVPVRCLVASRPPQCKLLKFWVRGGGIPYLVTPVALPGEALPGLDNSVEPRVILSLTQGWADAEGRKPTLKGLGYALERAERPAREALGGDDRPKTPRYDDGTVDNGDPWYDGRGHGYTIVDGPRSGTAIPYEQIQAIALDPKRWNHRVQLRLRSLEVAEGDGDGTGAYPETDLPDGLRHEVKTVFTQAKCSALAGELPGWAGELPAGMALTSSQQLHWQEMPDFRLVERRWSYAGSDTDLALWLDQIRGTETSLYLSMAVDKGEFKKGLAGVDEAVFQSQLLGVRDLSEADEIATGISSSGRSLVVLGDEAGLARNLAAVQLHAVMFRELLGHILLRGGSVDGATAKAKLLLGQANAVLRHFDHEEVSEKATLQRASTKLFERLGVDERRRRVLHETRTLADQIEQAQSQTMEIVLGLLGLLGLVDAANGIHDLIDPTRNPLWWQGTAGAIVFFVAFGAILYRRR